MNIFQSHRKLLVFLYVLAFISFISILTACTEPSTVNRSPILTLNLQKVPDETLTFVALATALDPEGNPLTYTWYIDNVEVTEGISAGGSRLRYTFAEAGIHSLQVKVSDGQLTTVQQATINFPDKPIDDDGDKENKPVQVSLSANPVRATVPAVVNFAVILQDPEREAINITWDFGDGTVEESLVGAGYAAYTLQAVHPYIEAGSYEVKVVATDAKGLSTTKIVKLELIATSQPTPSKPTASFSLIVVDVTGIIEFDASSSRDPNGTIVKYDWNFGDGDTATGVKVSHRYAKTGSYKAKLTVTDNDGNMDSTITTININLQANQPNKKPRPADAPDVLVLGFAGRCNFLVCTPPKGNNAYLDNTEIETLQAITAAFEQVGYTTQYRSYAARLAADVPADAELTANEKEGYLEASAFLKEVYEKWIKDIENPTRVVVAGHSHGAIWMNLFLLNHSQITFDYAISLDGVCFLWWDDQETHIKSQFDSRALPRPYPLTIGKVCEVLTIPGLQEPQHLSDVIPNNVLVNLELMAGQQLFIYDEAPNYRFDGSRKDIITLMPKPDQYHGDIHVKGQEAMNWVFDMIVARETAAKNSSSLTTQALREILPPPAGFEYFK